MAAAEPMRRTVPALTAVVLLALIQASLFAQPAPPAFDLAGVDKQQFEQDRSLLLEKGRTQVERDDAARRLAARQTAAARGVLAVGLRTPPNPAAATLSPQLAAARALADDPTPDPQLVPTIAVLLRGDLQTTEAAVNALLNYRQEPAATDAVTRLRAFVTDRGVTSAAIR